MQTAAVRLGGFAFAQQPLEIIREHRWFLALVLIYALIGLSVAWSQGLLQWMSLSLYADGLLERYALWIVFFAFLYPIYVMACVRPARLTRYMIDDLRTTYLTFDRLFAAGIVLAVLPIFVSVFTSIKVMIPLVNPFDWDPAFAAWDRWLHGGYHPWEILHPLLGTPLITTFLNVIYHLWFFLLYGIVCWQAFARVDRLLRMQFFLSFLLAWALLGSGMAIVFASVGPCYYALVTGLPDPYAPLLAYLNQANEVYPVWALTVQDMLWEGYQSGSVEQGRGISAMPSMHIAAVVLNVLFGWRVSRPFGWFMLAFAVLTFLGSIHLAWHYAIDGYVSVIGTCLIWYAAGRFLKRDPQFRSATAR